MVDYIIIAVIIVAAGFGIYSTVKHFKGQGGCCGGSNYKPKKKKLKNVLYQMTFRVEGMHCDHCKNRVEEVVNDMKGLAGTVNLKKASLRFLIRKRSLTILSSRKLKEQDTPLLKKRIGNYDR